MNTWLRLLIICIMTTFIISLFQIDAEIFAGGFKYNTVTFVCEDGVSTSDCNLLKTAAYRWNGISSKRTLKYDGTKGSYNLYNAHVKSSTLYKHSNTSVLGEIIPGMGCTLLSGCRNAGINDVWTSAYLRVYTSNFPSVDRSLYMAKTATHEFGHINSMAHTSKSSVMNSGLSKVSTLTSFDKTEMKRKWGN